MKKKQGKRQSKKIFLEKIYTSELEKSQFWELNNKKKLNQFYYTDLRIKSLENEKIFKTFISPNNTKIPIWFLLCLP